MAHFSYLIDQQMSEQLHVDIVPEDGRAAQPIELSTKTAYSGKEFLINLSREQAVELMTLLSDAISEVPVIPSGREYPGKVI